MNALSSKDNATRGGWYRWGQLNKEAEKILAKVGATVDPRAIIGDLSFVDRQMVEIARALATDPKLLLLDEPAAGLSGTAIDRIDEGLRKIREAGGSTPALIITGSAATELDQQTFSATHLLRKPFRVPELHAAIAQILSGAPH